MEMSQARQEVAQVELEPAPQRRERRTRLQRVADTLTLRRHRNPTREEVRRTLPTFWPVFSILVTLVEIVLFIAIVVSSGGFAPIAFEPETREKLILGFNNRTEVVRRQVVPNFFVGPSNADLIHNGAKYTPVCHLVVIL